MSATSDIGYVCGCGREYTVAEMRSWRSSSGGLAFRCDQCFNEFTIRIGTVKEREVAAVRGMHVIPVAANRVKVLGDREKGPYLDIFDLMGLGFQVYVTLPNGQPGPAINIDENGHATLSRKT